MNEEENFDFNNQPGKIRANRKIINSGKPLVSIITPYYNSSEYVFQTANSVLNQTFPYWEWIIVNDGSTDKDTNEVLQKIKQLDNRIKIFNQENAGPAKARTFRCKASYM